MIKPPLPALPLGACMGLVLTALCALMLPTATQAGDAAAGEDLFKKCRACHSITAPDGTVVQKGGRTGPNLYGLIGRRIASDPDYDYGPALAGLGEKGQLWDAASLSDYLLDPTRWLRDRLDDPSARSKMSFKLGSGGADIAAYLAEAGH